MSKFCNILFVLLSTSLLILLPCKCSKRESPDYLFLITLDTTRADHVDYSLENNATTPNLAKLAAEGEYFVNAYALIPITLPSHASMFYSLHPHELKLYNNAQELDVSHPSVVEIFHERGYKCSAVISLGTVRAKWGLNRGFDEYVEGYRKPYLWYKTAEEVNEDAFRLIESMDGDKSFCWIHYSDPHEPYYPPYYGGEFKVLFNGNKLFSSSSIEKVNVNLTFDLPPGESSIKLLTTISKEYQKNPKLENSIVGYKNFSIAHKSQKKNVEVTLPEDWQAIRQRGLKFITKHKYSQIFLLNKTDRKINIGIKFTKTMSPSSIYLPELYKEQVKYMDEQIGKLVEFLKEKGIYHKSVFFIMGDHGEGLGEYQNHVGHINYLNKLFSQVPLILCGPSIQKRGVREELVSNLNVAPTLLDIANIKKPGFMKGDSVLRPLVNKRLLLETYSPEALSDAFSIIDFPFQIILYPSRKDNKLEYINLERDSLGIENIIGTEPDSDLKSDLIRSVRKQSRELIYSKERKGEISEKDLEILRALGYIR